MARPHDASADAPAVPCGALGVANHGPRRVRPYFALPQDAHHSQFILRSRGHVLARVMVWFAVAEPGYRHCLVGRPGAGSDRLVIVVVLDFRGRFDQPDRHPGHWLSPGMVDPRTVMLELLLVGNRDRQAK